MTDETETPKEKIIKRRGPRKRVLTPRKPKAEKGQISLSAEEAFKLADDEIVEKEETVTPEVQKTVVEQRKKINEAPFDMAKFRRTGRKTK